MATTAHIGCWLGQVLKVLEGYTGEVKTVAISIDGGKIVLGCRDNILRVWSTESGEVHRLLVGSCNPITQSALHCLPDQTFVRLLM